jgi:hypothetical protein
MPVRAIQWCPVYTEGAELGETESYSVKTCHNTYVITEMSYTVSLNQPTTALDY